MEQPNRNLPSLNNVSRKSKRKSKLDDFDWLNDLGADSNQVITEEFMSEAEVIASDFIARVHRDFPHESSVTGNLLASLRMEVTEDQVFILGSPYLIYQELGVQGAKDKSLAPNSPFSYTDKKPPASVFYDWAKRKNLNAAKAYTVDGRPSPFQNLTREQQLTNLSYAMREKVYQSGFKPLDFFAKNIPGLVDELKASSKDYAITQLQLLIKTKLGADLIPEKLIN